jgi:AcrR family transcriptional regulator
MAQQDRAIRTRQSILAAAATVFNERGYNSATIGEILARAEVTKGALYFHFASKKELALGVFDAQMADVPTLPQTTKLQELVDSGMVLAHRLSYEPLARASMRLALDQGATGLDRGAPFRTWIELNLRTLREARDQGELLPHINLADTAEVFAGAFSGVQMMSQVTSDGSDLSYRISVLLKHLMPSIAVAAVLASLDIGPDRGVRILAEMNLGADLNVATGSAG